MPLSETKSKTRLDSTGLAGFVILPLFGIAALRLFAFSMPYAAGGSNGAMFIAVQMGVIVALILVDGRLAYTMRQLRWLIAIATAVMAFAGVLSAYSFSPEQRALAFAASVLRSGSSAVLIMGYGLYLCSIDVKHSIVTICGGFAVYGILSTIIHRLSGEGLVFASLLFAFAAGYCLLWGMEKSLPRSSTRCASPLRDVRKYAPLSMVLVLILAVSYTALGILNANMSSSLPTSELWPLMYCVEFAAVIFWVLVLKRDDPDKLIPAFILILFIGPLFFLAFQSVSVDFSFLVFDAIRKNNMLVVWTFFVAAACRTRINPVLLFGLGHLALLQVPQVIASFVRPLLRGVDESLLQVIGLVVVFVAVVAMFCVAVGGAVMGQRKKATDGSEEGLGRETPLARAAEIYRLSSREAEIAGYLHKGYTLPQIADTLFISEQTVRTHVKNVYKKTDVHKKQDLIAILESLAEDS